MRQSNSCAMVLNRDRATVALIEPRQSNSRAMVLTAQFGDPCCARFVCVGHRRWGYRTHTLDADRREDGANSGRGAHNGAFAVDGQNPNVSAAF